jgi:hypothetical protein
MLSIQFLRAFVFHVQGIDIREMLTGASIMDEATRIPVVYIIFS